MNIISRSFFRIAVQTASLVAAVALPTLAGPYDAWAKYKNITLNTKATGANVATSVANFPVLVRLDSVNAADVFAEALPAGADIRFANAAGVARPFEIEHWNAVAKTAAVWVLADTVKGNDSIASLRLYWGKADATAASNAAAVYDTLNGFVSNWHLGNASGLTDRPNSVPGAPAAVLRSYLPGYTAVPGLIGMTDTLFGDTGDSTAATARYLDMRNNNYAGYTNFTGGFTFSSWVRPTSLPQFVRLFELLEDSTKVIANTSPTRVVVLLNHSSATNSVGIRWGSQTAFNSTANQVAVATWKHLTITHPGGSAPAQLFVDGALVGTTASYTDLAVVNRPFMRMGRSFSTDAYFNGKYDEVSMAKVSRSADWTKLSFENQKAASTAVTLGTSQSNLTPTVLHGFAYGDSAKAADTLATFVVGTTSSVSPTYVGGPVDSFLVVSGTLPAGITLNKTTGAVGGNASAVAAASDVMVRAYGHAAMGDSVTRTIRVASALGPTAAFSYGRDTLKTTIGVLADTLSPSFTGRAPTGYSVTPALPNGFALNATTGKLTGTPTGPASTGTFTLKGTNATDTVTKALVIVVAVPAPENYATQWAGHKDLYINTTTNGAAITENLTKFPLAIRLNATNFNNGFAQSNATGADIRFTKVGDAVRLPHQVEMWDSATKQALIWVLVDSIKGNERNQRIRMHWNKAGAPNLSNNPVVFDTANGFAAVWHMNEASVSVGQSLVDATPNATTAKLALQGTGTAPVNDSTTPLGVAKTFGGSNTSTNTNGAYFYVADSSSSALGLNTVNGPFTISAWAKPVVCASGTRITVISKYNNNNVASTRAWALQTAASGESWRMTLNPNLPDFTAATADNEFVADEVCTIDTWQYVTGKYYSATTPVIADGVSAANLSISVNAGTPITGSTATQANGASIGDASPVFIGRLNGTGNTNNRFMRGTLDEIVVSKVLRSQDWVKLSYETQKAGAIVVTDTLAPPVGIHGAYAARTAAMSLAAKPLGTSVLFSLRGAPEGKAVLLLTDMRGRKIWTGAFAAGASELVWDGHENDGSKVPAGIYAVRLSVLDAQGRVTHTLHHKVPLAR